MFITTVSHHVGETFLFDPYFFPRPRYDFPLFKFWNRHCSGAGATHMKTMSSGAGAMFMKKRAPGPKLYHFYDDSAALRLEASKLKTSCFRVIATNKRH